MFSVDLHVIHQKVQEHHKSMELQHIYLAQGGLIRYYNVDNLFVTILLRMHDHKLLDSNLFKKFWKKSIKKIGSEIEPLDQSTVMEDLVMPVQKTLLNFLLKAVKEDLPARKLKGCFKSKESAIIEKELDQLIKHFELDRNDYRNDLASKLASKIHCILRINQMEEISKQILTVADQLKLTGDFEAIHSILQKVRALLHYLFVVAI